MFRFKKLLNFVPFKTYKTLESVMETFRFCLNEPSNLLRTNLLNQFIKENTGNKKLVHLKALRIIRSSGKCQKQERNQS